MRALTQWEEMPVTPDMLDRLKYGRYRVWNRVKDGQDVYVVIHSTDDDDPDDMTTGSPSIPAALKLRGL